MISVRKARIKDAQDLLSWRNDAVTRSMSVEGNLINWQEHKAWLDRILSDPNRLMLIGARNGDKIGMVRFDKERLEIEVSININPVFRGKRLSSQLLTAGLEKASQVFGADNFVARVKWGNERSLRLFERCGFQIHEEGDALCIMRYRGQNHN